MTTEGRTTTAGLIRLTRPVNAVVAGLATSLGDLVATGSLHLEILLLVAIVALVTAAGNVVNDYFDVEIDRVNRPERPIPAGDVGAVTALHFALVLFVFGIALSTLTNPIGTAIALVNSALLVVYAAHLKRLPLVGNLAVSYLTASIFLFGGALSGLEGLLHALPVAAITFVVMLAREILKAAEDIEGDSAGGALTLPMLIGIHPAIALALACAVLAAAASLLPLVRGWSTMYLLVAGTVHLVALVAIARVAACTTPGCIRARRTTTILKAWMFVTLAIFVAVAVIGG